MVGQHVDERMVPIPRTGWSVSISTWQVQPLSSHRFKIPCLSLSIHPTWVNWNMCHGQVGLDQPSPASAGWEDGTCQFSSEFSLYPLYWLNVSIPIGSMYAIYGNIYIHLPSIYPLYVSIHIPAPWIRHGILGTNKSSSYHPVIYKIINDL